MNAIICEKKKSDQIVTHQLGRAITMFHAIYHSNEHSIVAFACDAIERRECTFDIDRLGYVTYGSVTSLEQYDYIARIEFTTFFVWEMENSGECDSVIDHYRVHLCSMEFSIESMDIGIVFDWALFVTPKKYSNSKCRNFAGRTIFLVVTQISFAFKRRIQILHHDMN